MLAKACRESFRHSDVGQGAYKDWHPKSDWPKLGAHLTASPLSVVQSWKCQTGASTACSPAHVILELLGGTWESLVVFSWCLLSFLSSSNTSPPHHHPHKRQESQLGFRLFLLLLSVQFSSVVQSCPTLCNSMNRSTPGLPVHHQLLEFTQTHVYLVSDSIQPSHPLLSPSPPAFNLSQHQGLLKWVSSLHQVATVLEFQLQHQSVLWIFRTDIL